MNKELKIMELVRLVSKSKKTTFVGLEYEKPVKLLKSSPIQGIKKHVSGVFGLGYDYEQSVNNKRLKEGKDDNFESLSLPYGEWEVPKYIIRCDDGSRQVRFFKNTATKTKVEYLDSKNHVLKYDDIENFLASTEKHKPVVAAGRQELENPVKIFNLKIENICKIKCGILDVE
jgi:hypothetical protein